MNKQIVVSKENGKFGIKRVSSGCVFGNFDSWAEAMFAIAECQVADSYRSE